MGDKMTAENASEFMSYLQQQLPQEEQNPEEQDIAGLSEQDLIISDLVYLILKLLCD